MSAERVDDLVADAARQHGARDALRDLRGGRLSWGELEREVSEVAAWLRDEGIADGDRVVIVLPNGLDFARVYWGILRAGAVCVPVNPTYTPDEIAHVLADSQARLAVTMPALAPAVTQAAAHVDPPPAVIDRVGAAAPSSRPAPASPVAVYCYTSGTTGQPKGARLTHRNFLANLAGFCDLPHLRLTPDDVLLGVLPFFHVFGLNVILNAAAQAGACVLAVDRFTPAPTAEAMREHDVTVAYGAPPVFAALNALPPVSLPSLRAAVSGADALPVSTFERFADRFGLQILEGYGLTEAAPVLTTNACSPEVRAGTVGHPLPGVDLRVITPEGRTAAPGEAGEITARGANVFAGYHGHREATAATLRDGWLHTGDLGVVDGEGYLRITGRLKDLVIVNGFNVYPAEVEAVLQAHPLVAEAAVIGTPDPRTGERVRAFVVPATDVAPVPADLIDHCRQRLARYKLPRDIDVVGSLPRTGLGKLQRGRLRPDAGTGPRATPPSR